MALFSPLMLRVLGLFFGCVAKFVTGSLFVFNVYQDAIKDQFNYTQKEVEVMSSMLNLGLGVGFVPGMFFDHFGPQWTSAVGLVVSVSAYLLLWSTTKFVPFYSANSWLMAIYFLVCGFGSVFTYMTALNTNIINFDKKYTGSIVGLLNAFFAGSPSVFATIYYNVFVHGKIDNDDTSNQDYGGFMLMFAIAFAIADCLCIAFIRLVPKEPEYTQFENETTNDDQNSQERKPSSSSDQITYDETYDETKTSTNEDSNPKIQEKQSNRVTLSGSVQWEHSHQVSSSIQQPEDPTQVPLSVKEILLNVDYQILIWMLASASCIGLVYSNNITVMSKSMHLDAHDKTLTIIVPIMNAGTSFLVGFFSDALVKWIPRIVILLFSCICFAVSVLLALLFAYKLIVLQLATAVAGMAIGILWSLSPTLMKEMFYVGNIGRNWGIAILLAGLVGFGAQEFFGALYDVQTPAGQTYCYGMSCIRGGLAVFLGVACFSVALGVVMQIRKSCRAVCSRPI